MADSPPAESTPEPDAIPLELSWTASTDRGRFRANNEDSFLALTFDGHEVHYLGKSGRSLIAAADFVFAVSDGMGGEKSGEFASRIALERITWLLPRSFRHSASGLATGYTDVLSELYSTIHANLLRLGQSYPECANMGATLSLTWFTPGWMYFAHIGDSRIYYLPAEGGLKQLTNDHTQVGSLRRKGQINEREARTHPMKNSLHQALGAGHQFIDPQVGAVGYKEGDRFLICSDGLIDGLWDRNLGEIIRAPREANAPTVAQQLVDEGVRNSGRDNVTALVIEIPRSDSTSPAAAAS